MPYKRRKLEQFQQECQKHLNNRDYSSAIEIYEKMFELSGDYIYKLAIANVYYKNLNNLAKATEIYKELESKLGHLPSYWWQNHEIQMNNENLFESTYSVYKAIELEDTPRKEV